MREEIIRIARENGADLVGFAPADHFDSNDPIFKIFPGTKTVIGLAFRVLRGIYRGIEEGSTYYQYTTMGVENMEETVMPLALINVSNLIEEEGFTALATKFRMVAAIEKAHEERYRALLSNVEMQQVFEKGEMTMWECRNCGHLVIGKKAPEVCPVCNHPKAYFELRAENY